jgi:CBS domain-containing protein
LRDALSSLRAEGVYTATVVAADGACVGSLTLAEIRARVAPRPDHAGTR